LAYACKLGFRGHRVETARLALCLRPLAALGQERESGGTGGEARNGGGLGPLKRQGFPGLPVPARRRALYLLASWRDGCNKGIVRARGFIIEQLQKPKTQFFILLFGLPLFTFLVLALAQWGGGSSCHWQFPKWFGCVLDNHDSLAAGLIGAAGALFAAWIAWTAVQRQINADRERATADRAIAEQLLSTELTDYAEALAAALRRLAALPEDAMYDRSRAVYEAAAYMAERVSRREWIANYQAMADTLSWDRRIKYGTLLRGLDELQQFKAPETIRAHHQDALSLMRRLANDFMVCLPNTHHYFEGLFLGSAKAMSLADMVDYKADRYLR
jgi:hypothetical protein